MPFSTGKQIGLFRSKGIRFSSQDSSVRFSALFLSLWELPLCCCRKPAVGSLCGLCGAGCTTENKKPATVAGALTKPVFWSTDRSKMLKGSKSIRLILGHLPEAAGSSLTMPGFLAGLCVLLVSYFNRKTQKQVTRDKKQNAKKH